MTNSVWPKRVAILGVGLLGGSVGLSLKRRLSGVTIVGLSRSSEKRKLAVDCGAVDLAVDNISDACRDADVVVVAAPVDRIAAMANEAFQTAPADCLITDVGSTKANIVTDVPDPRFVAAHPIAGSEKTGAENATAGLFDARVIIITPSSTSDPTMTEKCDQFWQLTGGRTVQMSAVEHDALLAAVSHVPHLMSALIARLLPTAAKSLVGSGWRDITRVAAGDPTLWAAICQENREAILGELDRLIDDTQKLRIILADNDTTSLFQWLTEAAAAKKSTF